MSPTYRDDEPTVALLDRCRALRRFSTDTERRLWARLRNRQVGGVKFRRQHQFGPYILDFYSPEVGLAVEADGGQHAEPAVEAYDAERTRFLEERGIRVVRFSDRDILRKTDEVVAAIWELVSEK